MKIISALAVAGLLAVATLGTAQAGVIRSAQSGTASSTFSGCCDIARTLDRSGLITPFNSGVDDFDVYLSGNPQHVLNFPEEWFSANARTATVTYDMGALYNIGRMAFWNEDAEGVLSMNVFGSSDGINFVQLLAGVVPTDHPIAAYGADVFSWGAQDLRYFRLDLTCDWCAIGEVAFDTSDAGRVPEPGVLGLAAVALLGSAAARRRRSV